MPFLGAVDATGRIHYLPSAQHWLTGSSHNGVNGAADTGDANNSDAANSDPDNGIMYLTGN